MLEKYRELERRIAALPDHIAAQPERVLLERELALVKSKLSRKDQWKLSKGID